MIKTLQISAMACALCIYSDLAYCSSSPSGQGFSGTTDQQKTPPASSATQDTPLKSAIYKSDIEGIKTLINNGADINETDAEGKTALMHAIENYNYLKLLLEKKPDTIEAKDKGGRTALTCAVMKGNLDCVKLLLDSGANIEAKDNYGLTPLMYASVVECAELLLERGANIKARDNKGRTPLMHAADKMPDISKLLLERGADIEAKDNEGKTALIHATIRKNYGCIKLLLRRGADMYVKDNEGNSAYLFSAMRGQYQSISQLYMDEIDRRKEMQEKK